MWKKYRLKQHRASTVKLALLVLTLLLLILLIGKTVNLVTSLNQSYSKELGSDKRYQLNKALVVNVVILFLKDGQFHELAVVSLHPRENKGVVLNISNETYFELPKSLGAWPVGSIWQLGQEEEPARGAQLVKLSVAKLLGLPIDGIIVLEKSQFRQSPTELIGEWRKNPLLIVTFLLEMKTDLSLTETIWFARKSASLRSDKIITLDLAKSVITESKLLPDSSRVLVVDNVKLDLFIREKMSDNQILQEGASIAIFNATKYPGLASHAARIVTNLGGNVVVISNSTQGLDKSKVYLRDPKSHQQYQHTLSRISQIFAPSCLNQSCLTDDPRRDFSRAQISIILGEDYYHLWYER